MADPQNAPKGQCAPRPSLGAVQVLAAYAKQAAIMHYAVLHLEMDSRDSKRSRRALDRGQESRGCCRLAWLGTAQGSGRGTAEGLSAFADAVRVMGPTACCVCGGSD